MLLDVIGDAALEPLQHDQDDQREIVLTANGPMWTPRWERVLSAVAPWQVGI